MDNSFDGMRHSFHTSDHDIVCICSALPDDVTQLRFDWFLSFCDDRWVTFHRAETFNVTDAEHADAGLERDHRWRADLVGRPLDHVLMAAASVADLQTVILDQIPLSRRPRLRSAVGSRAGEVSGLHNIDRLLAPARPLEMPRDPHLHLVPIRTVLPRHAARLRARDILTLGDAEQCTRRRLLDLDGIDFCTVDDLERVLLSHGAQLADYDPEDAISSHTRDHREAFHALLKHRREEQDDHLPAQRQAARHLARHPERLPRPPQRPRPAPSRRLSSPLARACLRQKFRGSSSLRLRSHIRSARGTRRRRRAPARSPPTSGA
jgi:hypothetical protein